jgi:hypothetical protein
MTRVLAAIVAVENQSVLPMVCVCVTFDIQHEMRHIVICSRAALQYFSTSHKAQVFRGGGAY